MTEAGLAEPLNVSQHLVILRSESDRAVLEDRMCSMWTLRCVRHHESLTRSLRDLLLHEDRPTASMTDGAPRTLSSYVAASSSGPALSSPLTLDLPDLTRPAKPHLSGQWFCGPHGPSITQVLHKGEEETDYYVLSVCMAALKLDYDVAAPRVVDVVKQEAKPRRVVTSYGPKELKTEDRVGISRKDEEDGSLWLMGLALWGAVLVVVRLGMAGWPTETSISWYD